MFLISSFQLFLKPFVVVVVLLLAVSVLDIAEVVHVGNFSSILINLLHVMFVVGIMHDVDVLLMLVHTINHHILLMLNHLNRRPVCKRESTNK